jgi:hypothetical protein
MKKQDVRNQEARSKKSRGKKQEEIIAILAELS